MSSKVYLVIALLIATSWSKTMSPDMALLAQVASTPAVLNVPGPNGLSLQFTHPVDGYYREVAVQRPEHPPIKLVVPSDTFVDGVDADGDNHVFSAKLQRALPGSLRLWSLDGHYVALTLYARIGGAIAVRNNVSKQAFYTLTGKAVAFSSKTQNLGSSSFAQWSFTKADVALLRATGSMLKESYPKE